MAKLFGVVLLVVCILIAFGPVFMGLSLTTFGEILVFGCGFGGLGLVILG